MEKEKKKTTVTLECSFCGEEFEREKKDIKEGQEYFYCSRKCVAANKKVWYR